MPRRPGVTAAETRDELLVAATRVFTRAGYDGASISAITAEAGRSSGALYAHYGSKAELFVAVIEARSSGELDRLLGTSDAGDVGEVVEAIGATLDQREPEQASLLLEAIVAASRDPAVAEAIRPRFVGKEQGLVRLIEEAQGQGALAGDTGAEAISRLATMLALGSLLTTALDLPAVDHADWTALITRLVDDFRSEGAAG